MKYEDFKLTATKKVAFSKKRSQKLIASQELWKSLKYLGLPKKKKIQTSIRCKIMTL